MNANAELSMPLPKDIRSADIVLSVRDLKDEMPFFIDRLGFRLDSIYPADDPAVALVSGHGLRLRLTRTAEISPAVLQIEAASAAEPLITPSGHRIDIIAADPPLEIPATRHAFMVRRLADSDAWVIGRAGMHYRDLITDRLGGSIIASHIRIPDGGPVPDMVHYHVVGFQLIFCYRGWVRLVYEDQGDPFVLGAGDCVIQPPQIRHRVLEASDNVEVLEIGVPAEHVTNIDHEMTLPNGKGDPNRDWSGSRFVHHKVAEAVWKPWRLPGWEARDTGIGAGTGGVAGVHVARPMPGQTAAPWSRHDTDIHFTFVKEGEMTLEADVDGTPSQRLEIGDAFVIPPYVRTRYVDPSPDCELIETTLPAAFDTTFDPTS